MEGAEDLWQTISMQDELVEVHNLYPSISDKIRCIHIQPRLCADCKNTPFGCSNDRKKVFTNCVHKDPQLTTKAIQKYKYKISFLQCDAEDYITSNLEEKKPYNSFHFAK